MLFHQFWALVRRDPTLGTCRTATTDDDVAPRGTVSSHKSAVRSEQRVLYIRCSTVYDNNDTIEGGSYVANGVANKTISRLVVTDRADEDSSLVAEVTIRYRADRCF